MEFKEFKLGMQAHLEKMLKDQLTLYVVDIDKEVMWNLYLDSFPPGTNDIYRKRREYDCGCCKQFIRALGNVVAIKGNKMISIWDFTIENPTFQTVANALSNFIHAAQIDSIFVTKTRVFGTDKSHELVDGVANTWEHFYAIIPQQLVNKSTKSEGDLQGDARSSKQVLKRSLDELTTVSVDTVLEVIAQNTLYKGAEWKDVLSKFQKLQTEYAKVPSKQKDAFCWRCSQEHGGALTRIRNHSIGTLLIDLSEGMDLDEAVKKYERIVAPSNYKRPKELFTKSMVESAKKTITELGLETALHRRFAKVDDITANNVLFVNRDTLKNLKGSTVFDTLMKNAGVTAKKQTLDKLEEVPIDFFIKDIMPTITSMEVMLENKHAENMVSLIAPEISGGTSLFKWGNNFSWAYTGNLTDSMKENVKAAGGNVEGVLRFSIQWNDSRALTNENDFDAHCFEPKGTHIYYGNKRYKHPSSGMLDTDFIHPCDGQVAVENIIYTAKSSMPVGEYDFRVHVCSHRGFNTGFSAEIEFDGVIHSFEYRASCRQSESISIARVTLDKAGNFTIKQALSSQMANKTIWNLQTNQFYPVTICMLSPNYWDSNQIGNKHWFFMLKDCKNPQTPSGFFNEFLPEHLDKHKRVFAALGNEMRVKASDDQLSGLGFSSTKRASVVVKVTGSFTRMLKIMF